MTIMKYSVILDTKTKYLSITTGDIFEKSQSVLFSVDGDFDDVGLISITVCKCFCLGYIQGNNKTKVLNNPDDFK